MDGGCGAEGGCGGHAGCGLVGDGLGETDLGEDLVMYLCVLVL